MRAVRRGRGAKSSRTNCVCASASPYLRPARSFWFRCKLGYYCYRTYASTDPISVRQSRRADATISWIAIGFGLIPIAAAGAWSGRLFPPNRARRRTERLLVDLTSTHRSRTVRSATHGASLDLNVKGIETTYTRVPCMCPICLSVQSSLSWLNLHAAVCASPFSPSLGLSGEDSHITHITDLLLFNV